VEGNEDNARKQIRKSALPKSKGVFRLVTALSKGRMQTPCVREETTEKLLILFNSCLVANFRNYRCSKASEAIISTNLKFLDYIGDAHFYSMASY
jgi:hypothetical protein